MFQQIKLTGVSSMAPQKKKKKKKKSDEMFSLIK